MGKITERWLARGRGHFANQFLVLELCFFGQDFSVTFVENKSRWINSLVKFDWNLYFHQAGFPEMNKPHARFPNL